MIMDPRPKVGLQLSVDTSLDFNIGEGKRRNEFAEWHVAWLAE